jgi:hypothetical protein
LACETTGLPRSYHMDVAQACIARLSVIPDLEFAELVYSRPNNVQQAQI